MAFQIVINLVVAFMWMFLSESYVLPSFIAGYIFGILILLLMRRFVPGKFYLIKVYSIIKLILIFMRELVQSNISMIKYVYGKKSMAEPGIIEFPLELKSNWEITILTSLISLTPGTLSMAVSEDNQKLFIHVMDIDDIDEAVDEIKNSFEKAIMEVTR